VTTLFDTGPLVAAIDRSDKHHARCAALLQSLGGPLLIPTTVIVEVCWLVEERPDVEAAFLESVVAGEFKHVAITAADLARTAELVRTYADLPLGAVDASVIAVAERLDLTDVASLDRRHFTVVRPKHVNALNRSDRGTRRAERPGYQVQIHPAPATSDKGHKPAERRQDPARPETPVSSQLKIYVLFELASRRADISPTDIALPT
jgi:uncharacterized protein